MASEEKITPPIGRVAEGEAGADELLASAIVERLERIAGREMAQRNDGRLDGLNLEPRVLAHDAPLKLLELPVPFENRRHLLAYATQIIVRAMIDHQRRRRALRRGGDHLRVSLAEAGDGALGDLRLGSCARPRPGLP